MKLKYYIRGVGCGILFTMFIFMVIIIPSLKLDSKIEKENNSLFKEIRDYLKEDTECVLAYNRPKEEKRKYKTIARRKITLTELAFGKRKL